MEKIKGKRKLITITCDNCGISFDKPISEYQRNCKLNRRNFCSRSCCGKRKDNHLLLSEISQYRRKIDEFTIFNYLLNSCRKRFKDFTLTLQDLKEQWELQNGRCPYTNIQLQIPTHNTKVSYECQASIDRVNNSIGYVKSNIEFVSLPINYLKNSRFTKEQTINYLQQISSNFH
jgi:hypothetical protein